MGAFERIADGTLLAIAGNGGTGGAGDGPRSKGLYAETAGLPSNAADSEYADDSVAILLRDGWSSDHDRSGSVGLWRSGAAVPGREVYGGNVVWVVEREIVVTIGPLFDSFPIAGKVGFRSEPMFGCVGSRSCRTTPLARALLTF